MNDSPITREEMIELFGSEMPIEAVNLLWDSDGAKTISELRAELRQMAMTHPSPPVSDDGRQSLEPIAPLVLRTEPQSTLNLGHSASVTAKGGRDEQPQP